MQQATSAGIVEQLQAAIKLHGLAEVARRLGVSRQTVAAMAAGSAVRPGSALLIETGLKTWMAS